jgi:hypothetical protein
VLSAPHLEPGTVHWKAYAFCVLEQLHRMLRRREVFATNSSKWGDPRAKLLDGAAWEQAKLTVLASLNLPAEAGRHLAARAELPANSQIVFDDDGRLHFAALEPEPEPASLRGLREAVEALLLTLAGFAYAPQLADLPDQKMWRIDRRVRSAWSSTPSCCSRRGTRTAR